MPRTCKPYALRTGKARTLHFRSQIIFGEILIYILALLCATLGTAMSTCVFAMRNPWHCCASGFGIVLFLEYLCNIIVVCEMANLDLNSRFAVVGYGSWATTIVGKLTRNGIAVNWHVRSAEVIEGVLSEGFNPRYVRDMELDRSLLSISADINEVVGASDVIVLCVPSAYLKSTLEPLTVSLQDKFIVSAIKGVVPGEYTTVLEYIHNAYGVSFKQLGLISGPTHAEEVSRGKLSYLTSVCNSVEDAEFIASALRSDTLRVSLSTDIYGVEYAGILKNIYSIASGIAVGLGYGDNFLAVLISKSAAELRHFLNTSYPYERNTSEVAYLGDLLVTCYSSLSRNRQFGMLIGRGCDVKSALNEMTMTAEGYYAARGIHHICTRHNISMPIAETVYRILYDGEKARKAIVALSKTL